MPRLNSMCQHTLTRIRYSTPCLYRQRKIDALPRVVNNSTYCIQPGCWIQLGTMQWYCVGDKKLILFLAFLQEDWHFSFKFCKHRMTNTTETELQHDWLSWTRCWWIIHFPILALMNSIPLTETFRGISFSKRSKGKKSIWSDEWLPSIEWKYFPNFNPNILHK